MYQTSLKSCICQLVSVCHLASHSTSLNFSILVCKLRIIVIVTSQGQCENEWINKYFLEFVAHCTLDGNCFYDGGYCHMIHVVGDHLSPISTYREDLDESQLACLHVGSSQELPVLVYCLISR